MKGLEIVSPYQCTGREFTELETVSSLTVHKSIYRRMFLRLEIDFNPVYCEGYYGTGIGDLE